MTELVRAHTDLDGDDLSWLHLLLADWQIIADLAFADLVLWLADRTGVGFWAAAQMRPTTGPTAYVDDIVGTFVAAQRRPLLDRALASGQIVRDGDAEWRDDVPVRTEMVPVLREGRILGVISRSTNLHGVRPPSRLELSYLQAAGELTQMIANGTFPAHGERGDHADSPRVGDGFVRIDATGKVGYASPNALSVYRRLGHTGDLQQRSLAEVTRELVPSARRTDEEAISAALGGRVSRDLEIDGGDVTLIVRSIPLRPAGAHAGALILLRDVTELRRRDRELVTKDAIIREIHHRVKNNLQTVAALLRLQSRRIDEPGARSALDEAVRRVGSIALVHEILSQAVNDEADFDEIADRLGQMVLDVAGVRDRVTVTRLGTFGPTTSQIATPLAMVLTELIQNAVEHGYPGINTRGRISLEVSRASSRIRVVVTDDGAGLPEGFESQERTQLGLSIVRTLIETELNGTLCLGAGPLNKGTEAAIEFPTSP
jgi:two-component system, sensor histidine kinase PdtaS